MSRFLRYQAPFLAMCVAIFAVSSLPSTVIREFSFVWDKLPHAIVFGLLAVLGHRAFLHQEWSARLSGSPALSAFLFAIFYGALDELHQYFVPGRTTDIWDFVADIVGAVIGLSVLHIVARTRSAHSAAAEGPADGV